MRFYAGYTGVLAYTSTGRDLGPVKHGCLDVIVRRRRVITLNIDGTGIRRLKRVRFILPDCGAGSIEVFYLRLVMVVRHLLFYTIIFSCSGLRVIMH